MIFQLTAEDVRDPRLEDVDWWMDHRNLAEVWRWLVDRAEQPADVSDFMDRPWKWTPEWQQMRQDQARSRA